MIGHSRKITALALTDSYLISASLDASIILWNPSTAERLCAHTPHTDGVAAIAAFDDVLVSAGYDSCVFVWNMDVPPPSYSCLSHSRQGGPRKS